MDLDFSLNFTIEIILIPAASLLLSAAILLPRTYWVGTIINNIILSLMDQSIPLPSFSHIIPPLWRSYSIKSINLPSLQIEGENCQLHNLELFRGGWMKPGNIFFKSCFYFFRRIVRKWWSTLSDFSYLLLVWYCRILLYTSR